MIRLAVHIALSVLVYNITPMPPPDPAPVTANADWTPVIQDFDGVPMALVPPGCFQMGSTAALVRSGEATVDEAPQHEMCFDRAYWIDQTEVTQAQFAAFGGVSAQPRSFAGDVLPADGISWFEARDFCALRGARLPTEPEWEYAARGPDGLTYPWGDSFIAENAVFNETSDMQPQPVGSRPAGASWVGALDMSGNLFEWTSTAYAPFRARPYTALRPFFTYPYDAADGREDLERTDLMRLMRGGSWGTDATYLRAADRPGNDPNSADFLTGFRCARDSESGELLLHRRKGTPSP